MRQPVRSSGRWKIAVPIALASLVIGAVAAARVLGNRRWGNERRAMRARLEARGRPDRVGTYDIRELYGLPAPVQRYFHAVLKPGQALVCAVSMKQNGTFDQSGTGAGWKSFTAEQRVITRSPGFDWDARITTFPGVTLRVRDAYAGGEGMLVASLWGLVPLAESRGSAETARAELMRFLAEAAWYPTALLPSQGVHWEPVDAVSANATFSDGANTVTMRFVFDAAGLIESVRADARAAMVGKNIVMMPWEGSFSSYREHSGMLVPLSGEAAWLAGQERKPYWRGTIHELSYEFAGPPRA